MSAELVQELEGRKTDARVRGWRTRVVGGMGPLTLLAGVIWAVVQPYRLTILHPHGQGFWWLVSEPPLFVIVVGLVFWRLIAPGLLEDLEASR